MQEAHEVGVTGAGIDSAPSPARRLQPAPPAGPLLVGGVGDPCTAQCSPAAGVRCGRGRAGSRQHPVALARSRQLTALHLALPAAGEQLGPQAGHRLLTCSDPPPAMSSPRRCCRIPGTPLPAAPLTPAAAPCPAAPPPAACAPWPAAAAFHSMPLISCSPKHAGTPVPASVSVPGGAAAALAAPSVTITGAATGDGPADPAAGDAAGDALAGTTPSAAGAGAAAAGDAASDDAALGAAASGVLTAAAGGAAAAAAAAAACAAAAWQMDSSSAGVLRVAAGWNASRSTDRTAGLQPRKGGQGGMGEGHRRRKEGGSTESNNSKHPAGRMAGTSLPVLPCP
jgi:hypothetical protein